MSYLPILERLDFWQVEAQRAHPGVVPCRAGCAACCHGPFDVTGADVALVIEAVLELPNDTKQEVRRRARDQMEAVLALEPGWVPPFDIGTLGDDRFDRISEALADLPCPLLGTDLTCLIYHRRPAVCRLIGLGLVTESGSVIENACPIQDRFPLYRALPPTPFRLEAWEAEEDGAKIEAAVRLFGRPDRADYETTIAGAILMGA